MVVYGQIWLFKVVEPTNRTNDRKRRNAGRRAALFLVGFPTVKLPTKNNHKLWSLLSDVLTINLSVIWMFVVAVWTLNGRIYDL